ncbi:VOC family protein [Alkalihalobacillus sp. R86527]|uniref:VOC family protein n=1 Tax=Alkalihalobacillus sp. R86527 TaxID=3093863 RepID=UPI00366FE5BA
MKIDYRRIHHIQICIPVGMENQARTFYKDILGFIEIEKPEALKKNGGFWLRGAGIEIHIGTETNIHPGKRHPAFEVGNINEARARLKDYEVLIQEETQIKGYERFTFFDPFRNRIEFIQPKSDS